jgi:hypothetical protein
MNSMKLVLRWPEMASSSPLAELNALLDSFIPLTKKVNIAKAEALEKESAVLEKILARAWVVMPYLHENDEPGQCTLINRTERVITDQDSGFAVHNTLTLLDDGPRLVRSFTVEHWGTATPAFAINDRQTISCLDAIKTYSFEEICAALVDMIEFNGGLDVEYKALQARIERADTLISVIGEKVKVECLESVEATQ